MCFLSVAFSLLLSFPGRKYFNFHVFLFIFSLGKLNMLGYPFLLFHVLSESRDVQSLFLVCGRRNGLPTEPEP